MEFSRITTERPREIISASNARLSEYDHFQISGPVNIGYGRTTGGAVRVDDGVGQEGRVKRSTRTERSVDLAPFSVTSCVAGSTRAFPTSVDRGSHTAGAVQVCRLLAAGLAHAGSEASVAFGLTRRLVSSRGWGWHALRSGAESCQQRLAMAESRGELRRHTGVSQG